MDRVGSSFQSVIQLRIDRLGRSRLGLEALREYARTPVRFTPFKRDLLLRLLIRGLVGEGPKRASVSGKRRRAEHTLASRAAL